MYTEMKEHIVSSRPDATFARKEQRAMHNTRRETDEKKAEVSDILRTSLYFLKASSMPPALCVSWFLYGDVMVMALTARSRRRNEIVENK